MAGYSIPIKPHLSDSLRAEIGFQIETINFGFKNEDGAFIALEITDDYFHRIYDDHDIWTPDSDYKLRVNGSVRIEDSDKIFGCRGIAPSAAKVGVGIRWGSNQSRRRGTIPVTVIDKESTPGLYKFDYLFDAKTLRGVVDFSAILYIYSPGIPFPEESYLANREGEIIGETEVFKLSVDGNTPDINIVWDELHPDNPLWWINCEVRNPFQDAFDEKALTICLNSHHKAAKFLDKNHRNFVEPFFAEVMASAMTLFFEKIRSSEVENLKDILSGEYDEGRELTEGSIADNIIHFQNDLDIQFDTPELTAKSIRKLLDSQLFK